jgi:hypothetical protein
MVAIVTGAFAPEKINTAPGPERSVSPIPRLLVALSLLSLMPAAMAATAVVAEFSDPKRGTSHRMEVLQEHAGQIGCLLGGSRYLVLDPQSRSYALVDSRSRTYAAFIEGDAPPAFELNRVIAETQMPEILKAELDRARAEWQSNQTIESQPLIEVLEHGDQRLPGSFAPLFANDLARAVCSLPSEYLDAVVLNKGRPKPVRFSLRLVAGTGTPAWVGFEKFRKVKPESFVPTPLPEVEPTPVTSGARP